MEQFFCYEDLKTRLRNRLLDTTLCHLMKIAIDGVQIVVYQKRMRKKLLILGETEKQGIVCLAKLLSRFIRRFSTSFFNLIIFFVGGGGGGGKRCSLK